MVSNEVSINVKATDAATSVFQKIGVSGETMTQKVGSAISTLGSKIGGEFGEVLSGVSSAMDGMGQAGTSLGTKLTAAGVGVTGLGISMMALGSGEQAASQQMNAAILATGDSVSTYSDAIDQAVSKGEDFGHSGTDTKNAIARLTETTNDAGKSIADMGLVENIAAAKHESLTAAAQQLSLALNGNVETNRAGQLPEADIRLRERRGQSGLLNRGCCERRGLRPESVAISFDCL
jgi:hypothetical protein